jgi:hypothetical protein
MITRALCLVAPLLLAPAIACAQPASFAPDPNGHTDFILASGKVGCTYIPAGGTKVYKPKDGGPELSCDSIEPKYRRYELGKSGKARQINNPNEQNCCGSNNTLGEGARWSGGPFTCESSAAGLSCKRSDGRGFAINPKGGGRVY